MLFEMAYRSDFAMSSALNVPFYIFDASNVETAGVPAQFDTGYGDAYISGFRTLWGLDG